MEFIFFAVDFSVFTGNDPIFHNTGKFKKKFHRIIFFFEILKKEARKRMKISQMDEKIQKKYVDIYLQLIETIETLVKFLRNKLISDINLNSEFNKLCSKRQEVTQKIKLI